MLLPNATMATTSHTSSITVPTRIWRMESRQTTMEEQESRKESMDSMETMDTGQRICCKPSANTTISINATRFENTTVEKSNSPIPKSRSNDATITGIATTTDGQQGKRR